MTVGRALRSIPLLAAGVILTACPNQVAPIDAGPGRDAAPPQDAEVVVDGGAPIDAGHPDVGVEDAGMTDTGAECIPDLSCTTNPSPCRIGRTACAGGAESCQDAEVAPNATPCANGVCTNGICYDRTTIDTDRNFSIDPIQLGRTCAASPQYEVLQLDARTATLRSAPAADCLAVGDEVLLINLQGTGAAVDTVGNWEVLSIESVSGETVTFSTDKQRFYGDADGSDVGVGTEQKVALVRIPQFGELQVDVGVTLTAMAWDGSLGGVFVLRASSLNLDGAISVANIGYRSGAWSRDGECVSSTTTVQGESIGGLGVAAVTNNAGGSGGIDGLSFDFFGSNTPVSATAGHAAPGVAGVNAGPRTLGDPGEAYGVDDGSRLTMGSGPGGNLTCLPGVGGVELALHPYRAAGIVVLLVDRLTVATTGAISATPDNDPRDVAASGGYVFVRGGDLSIGEGQVTAQGAVAIGGSPATANVMLPASPGYVVIESSGTVSGTSDPPANVIAP